MVKNDDLSQVQLHYSRQNSQGPFFELIADTYRLKVGQGGEALHPYKTKLGRELNGPGSGQRQSQHPTNPVDRVKFNVDRNSYWEDRIRIHDQE